MSQKDMIYDALAQSSTVTSRTHWTVEEIAVIAWSANPTVFGMKGYEDRFPDKNKVLTNIIGKNGMVLCQQTLIKSDINGRTVYSLGSREKSIRCLASETAELMYHLLDSIAVRKFSTDRMGSIDKVDAMAYFGVTKVSELASSSAVEGIAFRIDQFRSGGGLTPAQVSLVKKVTKHLYKRFCAVSKHSVNSCT